MKIEIEWQTDYHDCETCGGSGAEGAIVTIDGEVVADMTPYAHCFDSVSHEPNLVYEAILKFLGHELVETRIDNYDQPYYEDDE